MQKFHDYTELSEQIHVPDELKARVLRAARESKGQVVEFKQAEPKDKKKPGKYSRGFSFLQKAAVAAILAFCIPVAAYAATKNFGLLEHLSKFGFQNTQEMQELVETFPSEAATSPETMDNGEIKVPEFRIKEALCDDYSLCIVTEIKPMDDRYLLVPDELSPEMDIGNMIFTGIAGMTIEEYADSLDKEILYVGTRLDTFNEYGVGAGLLSECTEDGTVYQYFYGENVKHLKEFPLTITCLYLTPDMPMAEKFDFDVQITNKSQEKKVTTFTEFEDPGMGVTVHSLTLEETEIGIYAEFVFSYEGEGEGFGFFDLRDANGEDLRGLAISGNLMYEDNGDGTYTSKSQYKKTDFPDDLTELRFSVQRVEDYERFGPFKILG